MPNCRIRPCDAQRESSGALRGFIAQRPPGAKGWANHQKGERLLTRAAMRPPRQNPADGTPPQARPPMRPQDQNDRRPSRRVSRSDAATGSATRARSFPRRRGRRPRPHRKLMRFPPGVAGFLRTELVARETEDHQSLFPIALVQCLEAGVLWREAAMACRIDDQQNLARVFGQGLTSAGEALGGELVNGCAHGAVSGRDASSGRTAVYSEIARRWCLDRAAGLTWPRRRLLADRR